MPCAVVVKRPAGIVAICAVNALAGVLGLLGSTTVRSALGIVVAAGALLTLLSVYGLWTFEAWGWLLVGILYGMNVLYYVYEAATGNLAGLLGVAIAGLVLLYLYRLRDFYLSDERPREKSSEKPTGKRRGEYKNRR